MRRAAGALGVAVLITVSAVSSRASAQRVSRYSVDATVGVGLLQTKAQYSARDDGGLAGELALSRRVHSARAGGLVAGVNAGYYYMIGGGDVCTLYPPHDRCAPQTPDMRLVGMLSGWESRAGTFRALGGVAYAHPPSGGGAVAIQARLEAAVGIVRHVALTASVRPVVVPSYRGDTFRLLGIGLGVRIR
jgi:hypothetical protein